MENTEAEKIIKKYNIDKEEIKKLSRIRYINNSVSFLKNAGLYYEAILFSSQVIEFALRKLIEDCEKIIEEVINKRTVVKYEKNLKLEKKTLGPLIYLVKKRIKNKKLIEGLEEFLDIRNDIAHNLIVVKKDIKEIEKDVSEYVENGKIFELLKSILTESNILKYKQLEKELKEKNLEMPQFLKNRLKEK
ncbi:MAG: hypothetical protein WAV31_01680 [Candidatus Moraniibacteriota bacterium]